jgi:hypothetical protein
VGLETYTHFADRDPLTRLVCEQMLAGDQVRPLIDALAEVRRGRPLDSDALERLRRI